VRQEKADLRFRYDELRQQAASEAEKNRLTQEEIRLSNEIDKAALAIDQQNADTSRISANKPTASSAERYGTGTYQQKLAAVIQDELQNVEETFLPSAKPAVGTRLPVISNATGRPVVNNGKVQTQAWGERAWQNNARLAYREHMFAKLWPMVEGNIAKGNRDRAKQYLRGRLWKVALQWDPNATGGTGTGVTLPTDSGADDGVS
jgi:hypothetical protein